jgi:hypothetical protein
VDLDYLQSGEDYLRVRCYCQSGIVRINAHQIYDIDDPSDSALLFCFGRKTVHFHKYEPIPNLVHVNAVPFALLRFIECSKQHTVTHAAPVIISTCKKSYRLCTPTPLQ